MRSAIAVQLPLEGAIARAGGFGAVGRRVAALEHWRLGSGDPAGKRDLVGNGDPRELIEQVLAEITRFIARFDDPTTPYRPVPVARLEPRYSDYKHLERLGESEIET